MTCVTLALSENFKKWHTFRIFHILHSLLLRIAYRASVEAIITTRLLYYECPLALKAGVVKDDSCASTENFSLTSIFLVPVERAGARKGKLRRTKPKELGGIVLNVFSKAATLPLKYLLH